ASGIHAQAAHTHWRVTAVRLAATVAHTIPQSDLAAVCHTQAAPSADTVLSARHRSLDHRQRTHVARAVYGSRVASERSCGSVALAHADALGQLRAPNPRRRRVAA